jgi:hypothetical protein
MRARACPVHWIHSTIQLLQEEHLLLEETAASVSMTWSIRSYSLKGLTKNWHKSHHHAKDVLILIDKWGMGDDDMGTAVTDSFQSSRIYDR